ncbi:hypothetical protein DMC47_28960 [Nostoc sp. 3335mG]|nr:hypothetical protein DMC47_28960 [Nostoc sp. 3335mG]
MATDAVPDRDAQLRAMAERLTDIAAQVAKEAEATTAAMRALTDQAERIASLAKALESTANVTESGMARQADMLHAARGRFDRNASVIDELGQSIEGVATISATIGGIAQESRILSLNARIEAARSGHESGAFAAVAAEMSTLTGRVLTANEAIGDRAQKIAHDVQMASDVVVAHGVLLHEQDGLIDASRTIASQQRDAATQLSTITAEAAAALDMTARAIGRVGAGAVAAKVLARQLRRLTEPSA